MYKYQKKRVKCKNIIGDEKFYLKTNSIDL